VEKKNGGDGYMQGIELAGEYRFTPNWTAFGQVTWTEGRVDQFVGNTDTLAIEPLSRVMPFMWRTGIRWQSTDRRLWSEFLALGQSHYNRMNNSDLRDTQRIPPEGNPSFTILTLRGGWEITKNFGVNVSLENLGNEQYRYTGSGSNESGFNAILGATVKW
jgi:hemoglobin/transferrin/lactoferrin receptor protein